MTQDSQPVLSVVPHRTHRTVATHQQGNLRQATMNQRPVSRLDRMVNAYRFAPFSFDRKCVARFVPDIGSMPIEVTRHLAFDLIVIFSPGPSPDMITPGIRAEIKLEVVGPVSALSIVQK